MRGWIRERLDRLQTIGGKRSVFGSRSQKSILEQYGGELETFIADLGDASKITATISHNFSPAQLLGLQQIVMQRDIRLLDQTEKHWNEADAYVKPLAVPKSSFNMVSKKVQAPIEEKPKVVKV